MALAGVYGVFQSTRPSRGETVPNVPASILSNYFNPLAPRGARLVDAATYAQICDFNPLAPRGARRMKKDLKRCCNIFQSTRPSRGETLSHDLAGKALVFISIHSPLAGRDASLSATR